MQVIGALAQDDILTYVRETGAEYLGTKFLNHYVTYTGWKRNLYVKNNHQGKFGTTCMEYSCHGPNYNKICRQYITG